MPKEYIERGALLENLSKFAPEHNTPLIQLLVTRQPTADVVEVCRCGECKYFHQYNVLGTKDPSGWGKCKIISMDIDLTINDFCSYGERKDK